MRRMWPEEYVHLLDAAEEVELHIQPVAQEDHPPAKAIPRKGLRVRLRQQDFETIWPLAEARYRLGGRFSGKAITLITTNPHYRSWHPSDGGSVESTADSGKHYTTRYVIVHFLLDDVRETVDA